MPLVKHRRNLGKGTHFDGVDHYVMTLHVSGPSAARTDQPEFARARTGALSLQIPMSGGLFATNGIVDYAHFYFTQSLVDEVTEDFQIAADTGIDDFFALHDPLLLRDAEVYCLRACDRANPACAMEMDWRAALIVASLLRLSHRLARVMTPVPEVGNKELQDVLAYIETHIAEPLCLEDLARRLGTSPFRFARAFKSGTGSTPWQYIMKRRCQYAIRLISTSNLPLADIAYQAGFSSHSHMNRDVKRSTGRTPLQLRQAAR